MVSGFYPTVDSYNKIVWMCWDNPTVMEEVFENWWFYIAVGNNYSFVTIFDEKDAYAT